VVLPVLILDIRKRKIAGWDTHGSDDSLHAILAAPTARLPLSKARDSSRLLPSRYKWETISHLSLGPERDSVFVAASLVTADHRLAA
jgi:hypothetical protein